MCGHILELRDGDVVLVGGSLDQVAAQHLSDALARMGEGVGVYFVGNVPLPATVLRREEL